MTNILDEVPPTASPEQVQNSGDPYLNRPRRQRWLVIVLTLAAVMAVIDRTILSLLFDPIKNDLGFSDTQMALVFGFAFAIANVLFTLPAGYLADRISRRSIITLGGFVWSGMTSLCGVAMSFGQLLFARAGVGFAESVIHPCSFSMLRSALPVSIRGRGFAVYGMSLMVGSALGFIIGGILIEVMTASGIGELPLIGDVKPWRLVMLALGVIGLPFALLVLTVKEPPRNRSLHQNSGTFAETLNYMKRYWSVYVPLVVYSATISMQANAYGAFLAPIPMRRWEIPVESVGRVLGLMMLFAAPAGLWITGVLMDKLSKKYGPKGVAIIGVATIFMVMILATSAPIAPSPLWFYILTCGVFFVGGTGFIITGTLISLITPARNMGKTSAVQLFIYGIIGMGVGPAIVGAVSDTFFPEVTQIGTAMAICCGIFTFISFLSMCTLLRTLSGKTFQLD